METDSCHWMPGSFSRRPEWRWLRAENLRATGRRYDARVDDQWVKDACLARRGSRTRKPEVVVVQDAHELWTGDPTVRGKLEAFLLTDLSFAKIAEKCGLTRTVVEAYEAVFFAVRAMRNAFDWLLTRAVGYTPWCGFSGLMPASSWKLAALEGGPIFLELVMAATTGQSLKSFVRADPTRCAEQERLRGLVLIWVASKSPMTDEEFAAMIRARRRLSHNDKGLSDRDEPLCEAVVELEAFLLNLQGMKRKGQKTERSKGGIKASPPAFSAGSNATENSGMKAKERRANVGKKSNVQLGEDKESKRAA